MSSSPASERSASRQSGTVLLALLLIILAASSYALLTNLNEAVSKYTLNANGLAALQEAKQVLIGYALTYPERTGGEYGPGYLPCPDTNDDGQAESSCSIAGGTFVGRIPWKTLEIDNLKDNAGETIWYALSDNYRNNPKLVPLNSETPGQLTVDNQDDIVAVLIAPGVAIGNQDRSAANVNDAAQYLDGENGNLNTNFVSSSSSDEFNDVVVTITRKELMRAVERRVLGVVKDALANYRNTGGLNLAYPWLAPFADPKTDQRRLIGKVGSGPSNTVLIDNTADFSAWNVSAGDVVHNLTDGSVATVTSVDSTHQLTTSGLVRGDTNRFATAAGPCYSVGNFCFADGDVYVIDARNYTAAFTGNAGSGSSGTTLVDGSRNFGYLGVGPGDVIEDVTDGSRGIIKSADNSGTIVADSLQGGTSNVFQFNDQYRIRTNAGIADSGSSGQTLVDNGADFVSAGIAAGDYVHDLTDDTFGKVAAAPASPGHQLTVSNPNSNVWPDVNFAQGHEYEIIRHLPVTNSRYGQLAFHEPGRQSFTGFQLDWSLPYAAPTITYGAGSTDADYQAGLKNSTRQSSGVLTNANAFNIASNEGMCRFDRPEAADCYTKVTDPAFLSGTATGGSSSTILNDTSKNFIMAGIKPGDILENNTDGRTGFVVKVNSSTQAAINNYYGMTNTGISTGDSYRIKEATTSVSRSSPYAAQYACSCYYNGWTFYVWDGNWDFYATVKPGDIFVDTNGGGIGRVEYTWSSAPNYVLVRYLVGGSRTYMPTSGGPYIIYDQNSYVDKREYVLQPDFSGGMVKYKGTDGTRKRTVCVNYDSGCVNADTVNSTTFAGNTSKPMVTVTDYTGATKVASAQLLNISGTSKGSIRLAGMDYYLSAYPFNVAMSKDPLNGTATNASTGTTLDDSAASFISDGVKAGDEVKNTTGNVQGFVQQVDSGTRLTVASIGGQPAFSIGQNDQYQIYPQHELPLWFIRNKWYQFVYLGMSAADAPGGSGACTAGTNCLNLYAANTTGTPDSVNNKVGALAIMAGQAIDYRTDCTTSSSPNLVQDRTSGNINAWFECENALAGDDKFQQRDYDPASASYVLARRTSQFNDTVYILK